MNEKTPDKASYLTLYGALAANNPTSRIPPVPNENVADWQEAIDYLLARLSPEEREMLFDFYHNRLTLAEIGEKVDLSKERVRQKINIALNDMVHYDGDLFLIYGYAKGMEHYLKKAEQYRKEVEEYQRTSIGNLKLTGVVEGGFRAREIKTLAELKQWLDDPDACGICGVGQKKILDTRLRYDAYVNNPANRDPINMLLEDLGLPRKSTLRLQKVGVLTVADLVQADRQGKLVPEGRLSNSDILAARYYARPWMDGYQPLPDSEDDEENLEEYELINPSDPYTFLAKDLETATLVTLLLGQGAYAAKPKTSGGEEVPMFLFDDPSQWFLSRFGHGIDAGLKQYRDAVGKALASVMYGHFEDRRRYQAALEAITDPEKKDAFIAAWQDGCSSLNDIGTRAHKMAKSLNK